MAVWNEQAHRKLQMHWLVQMTHQWLNQHTQLQVKQAMPVDREQKIHRLKNRFRKTCATYMYATSCKYTQVPFFMTILLMATSLLCCHFTQNLCQSFSYFKNYSWPLGLYNQIFVACLAIRFTWFHCKSKPILTTLNIIFL